MSHSKPAGPGSACRRPPLKEPAQGICGLTQPLNNAGNPAGFAGVDASGSGVLCCCCCQSQHSLQRTEQRCGVLLMQAAKAADFRSTPCTSSLFAWPGSFCSAAMLHGGPHAHSTCALQSRSNQASCEVGGASAPCCRVACTLQDGQVMVRQALLCRGGSAGSHLRRACPPPGTGVPAH